MRKLAAAAAAALLAAGAACASSGSGRSTDLAAFDRPPVVALQDVRLGSVGLSGGSLDIVMRIYNPNEYDLARPRIAYRVLVDDDRITKGLYDVDVTIPANDSVKVRVPASFSYTDAGLAGRSLVSRGSVTYRVLGNITADTPYGRMTGPFDRAGSFSALSARRAD